jgi:hypothetical protein
VKAVFDPLCKHFEEQNWFEKRADKAGLKKALKTLVVWISKRPWGQARGLGRVPDFAYGVGSTVILEFTKASCPPRTLELAAQSLPYLAPDVQQQPTYPSQQDYATVYQLPHIAEALVASEAARDFNNSGATGMTGPLVLELSDALCFGTQRGQATTNLSAYLGRADLDALRAVDNLMALTLKNCRLSPAQAEALAGRLNNFLIINQHLAQLPPYLANPTWYCGAAPQQATLRWTPRGANPISGYELYVLRPDGRWTESGITVNPSTSAIPLINLEQRVYDFALRATDDQGNQSAWVYTRVDPRLCTAANNPTR